jgi:hypothetical protein
MFGRTESNIPSGLVWVNRQIPVAVDLAERSRCEALRANSTAGLGRLRD